MTAKFSAQDFKDGQVLLFDKPREWTSFDVVKKVRWLIKKNCGIKKIKVGHAGTLDPLATGLLILCTGKYTKRITEFQGLRKEYTGTFILGATTPSFDLETTVDQTFPVHHLNRSILTGAAKILEGEIEQYPPLFSALKKDGKRLYEYARKGETIKTDPRKITISQFDLERIALPEIDFKVICSKGTYIRSLARDFGQTVESGAYLSALRRTKIGSYTVKNAMDIAQFTNLLPTSVE